jgi:hypothetical protein
MAIRQLFIRNVKIGSVIIGGACLFLSIGHHVFNFWETPAWVMICLFVIFAPLLAWILSHFIRRIRTSFDQALKKQYFIVIIPTVLICVTIFYRLPASYNTLTITPIISQNQKVELLDFKVGDEVMSAQREALAKGWQIVDSSLVATDISQPLTITFKKEAQLPITVSFSTSPQSGSVKISLGTQRIELNLTSEENSQKVSHLSTQYRSIPNNFFIPIIVVADIISFSLLLMGLMLLQEIGNRSLIQQSVSQERFLSHRINLAVLLFLAGVLHILNALSVPLILGVDSPGYLIGAVHLIKYGNLDGVSILRGPGSTFLFAPVLFLFGRNPWGVKILLHLIAIACVFLSYRIGWQLSHKRWIAFVIGLITTLLPDLYIYSNYLMSDLPNAFIVLLYSTVFISAMETSRARWIISTMLIGSFAVLFRSENILLLVIGFLFIAIHPVFHWLRKIFLEKQNAFRLLFASRELMVIGLSLVVAILPLLWWSVHNYRVYGFFGLSNYAGKVFYDGWIYYGDASNISFSDSGSQAIQKINAAIEKYPLAVIDPSGVPTGTEIYPSLLKAGYSSQQALNLLESATWDSIFHKWDLTLKLLFIKIKDALRPQITLTQTFPLPGEIVRPEEIKLTYFNAETLSISPLIIAQRQTYDYLQRWYRTVYPLWIWISILATLLCFYRRPSLVWSGLVLITLTRIFVPNLMGLTDWRYTISGLVLLQVFAINGIAVVIRCGRILFQTKSS